MHMNNSFDKGGSCKTIVNTNHCKDCGFVGDA